ncbi:MAG: hypothetical protein EOO66_24485, partial [Methylobacterium sp.]
MRYIVLKSGIGSPSMLFTRSPVWKPACAAALLGSIGFGPELVGFNDRHGTRWKLCAIPLGGYVKFHGDANGASIPDADTIARMTPQERAISFPTQPVAKRAAIVV